MHQYLAALNEGNVENVLALFAPDAIVVSPMYGTMSAEVFYPQLFADTRRSDTTLLHIFGTTTEASSVALHFKYK